jgi:hypothetical protein
MSHPYPAKWTKRHQLEIPIQTAMEDKFTHGAIQLHRIIAQPSQPGYKKRQWWFVTWFDELNIEWAEAHL